MGAHRGRHADPAHGQPGQPDQHQERPDAVHETVDARRAAAAVAPACAAVGEGRAPVGPQRVQIGPLRQRQPIVAVEKRTCAQQIAVGQRLAQDQGAGAEAEAGRARIGFADQPRGQHEILRAKAEHVARRQPQPVGQQRRHHAPGQALRGRPQGLRQRHGRVQHRLTQKGPGRVDALDLGQGAFGGIPLPDHRHGPEIDDFGYRYGPILQPVPLWGRGKAIGQLHLGIAAQQDRALRGQPRLDRRAHRPHGGDGGHAKRQAGQQHPEPAQAPAQVAPRQPGRQRQAHAAASAARRPSARRITRSQRRARSGSCVTRTSVAP